MSTKSIGKVEGAKVSVSVPTPLYPGEPPSVGIKLFDYDFGTLWADLTLAEAEELVVALSEAIEEAKKVSEEEK